jgi:predicted methyltransferase
MTKATHHAHLLVQTHLASLERLLLEQPSLLALDATVGNGFDTAFLAECVGEHGLVIGFDVQDMSDAAQNIAKAGIRERVQLLQRGHETMLQALSDILSPSQILCGFHAIMFNLGYLPHGDKSLTTRTETTLAALQQSAQILASGGILTVICYPAHDGGSDEAAAVLAWAKDLSSKEYGVSHTRVINKSGMPPELFAVYKY